METDNFITENFPKNGRKLESIENKIRDTFLSVPRISPAILDPVHTTPLSNENGTVLLRFQNDFRPH